MRTVHTATGSLLVLLLVVNAAYAAPQPRGNVRVLNLAKVPVEINEPGHYVLDRSWRLNPRLEAAYLRVRAAKVYIDLKGYEITANGPGIFIEGADVTVRNGRLAGNDYELLTSHGRSTIVEDIQSIGGTGGIRLRGPLSVARNIVTNNSFVQLIGPDSLLDSSRIRCRQVCVWLGDQSKVTNSQVRSSQWVAVRLHGDGNVLANNTLTASIDGAPTLSIGGDDNVVLNNVFLNLDVSAAHAIVVEGSGNVLRDNIAPPVTDRWRSGIRFEGSGNFYGNNQMASYNPFDLQEPNQTDWGGNFGY